MSGMFVEKANGFALVIIAMVFSFGVAHGEDNRASPAVLKLCQKAENNARSQCSRTVTAQEQFLRGVGTKNRFTTLANSLADASEALERGSDLVNGYDRSKSRMQKLYSKHVFDASVVHAQLENTFLDLQRQLIVETVSLCAAANVPEAELVKTVKVFEIRKGAWNDAYDAVFAKAVKLSTQDLTRQAAQLGGSFVASNVIGNAVRDAKGSGNEERGLFDFVGDLIVGAVIDAAVDEFIDPVGQIADALHAEHQKCTNSVIAGFKAACESLTQHHLECRQQLLGLQRKAVK